MADDNSTTTRLLTLLNVSATKAGKKKWEPYVPAVKLNKRKSVKLVVESEDLALPVQEDVQMAEISPLDESSEVEGARLVLHQEPTNFCSRRKRSIRATFWMWFCPSF